MVDDKTGERIEGEESIDMDELTELEDSTVDDSEKEPDADLNSDNDVEEVEGEPDII